jgi:hypothetical protein
MTELVYYDVLEDKLVVYAGFPWLPLEDEYKTVWGDRVIYHAIFVGDL